MPTVRDPRFELIRVTMAFLVILDHTASGAFSLYAPGTVLWGITYTLYTYAHWAVPLFVMISGKFLLSLRPNISLVEFYRIRTRKILIPLVFWTVVYAIWKGYFLSNSHNTFELLKKAYIEPTCGSLWYLYMIIPLYFFAPFFSKLMSVCTLRERYIFMIGCFVMSLFLPTVIPYFPLGFLGYWGFFFAGYIFSEDNRTKTITLITIILVCGTILTYGTTCISLRYFKIARNPFTIVGSIAFFMLMLRIKIPEKVFLSRRFFKGFSISQIINRLAPLSFGIYLVHEIWLRWVYQYSFLLPDSIKVISLACVTFALSAMTTYLILKIPYLRQTV